MRCLVLLLLLSVLGASITNRDLIDALLSDEDCSLWSEPIQYDENEELVPSISLLINNALDLPVPLSPASVSGMMEWCVHYYQLELLLKLVNKVVEESITINYGPVLMACSEDNLEALLILRKLDPAYLSRALVWALTGGLSPSIFECNQLFLLKLVLNMDVVDLSPYIISFLYEASRNGRISMIQEILYGGHDYSLKALPDFEVIELAAQSNDLECMKYWLHSSLVKPSLDYLRSTRRRSSIPQALLSLTQSVNRALHLCIESGHNDMFIYLYGQCGKISNVCIDTLISYARLHGNMEMQKWLQEEIRA